MEDRKEIIRRSVIRDMSEGLITVSLNGTVESVNPAAAAILERRAEDLIGKSFAGCFFEYEENDAFNQMVLDAVYDSGKTKQGIVPYFTGDKTKQLQLTSSYLTENDRKIAVILVLSDISELAELRDALKAMEKIRALNAQLELRNKLLNETFGRFLSDDIVKELLETPEGLALGGRKRCLTVLMSDLRGFTALSERMPANDLLSMLNHYLGEMTVIIQERGGTIIEFIGDGIMAIFGAPRPSEKHAEEAVAAAVSMQARMHAINDWNRAQGYPALEMGIGLHTGDVIVGNIGSEKRTKYGVTGREVNFAGRIESYTVGGQILISEALKDRVNAELTLAGREEVRPKGADRPLTLYAVEGIGAPYSVSCGRMFEEARPLNTPCPVTFRIIRDKHVGEREETGCFTALSPDEALLETEARLLPFDNLQLSFGGKLFAKVLKTEAAVSRLHFTSRPEGFEEALQAAGK